MSINTDPWEVAKNYYDRQMRQNLAAIMKAAGLSQIDVPASQMMNANDTISIEEHEGGTMYRIRGRFEVSP